MRAIIISTGDELASGRTVDTNSAWLAQELEARGVLTLCHHTAGDDSGLIASLIGQAVDRAEIVLVTGGLGPTPDDLTRQALADVMGVELELHAESLNRIEEFFRRRGREMVQANRIQAMIPIGATPLDNDLGTAPGIFVRIGGAIVACMPGVPIEMKAMFDSTVSTLLPESETSIAVRLLRSYGMGESNLSEKINDILAQRRGDVIVGTSVSDGLISLRIVARGDSDAAASALAEETAANLADRLGDMIIGTGSETMASVVGKLLAARGQTVSLAESCTGGLVGRMITSVSGASEYFAGGIVSYSNTAKRDILGVRPETLQEFGAVSKRTALEMAHGARGRFASDWAISLTGIAGPGGGSAEKPVGLVYTGLVGLNVEQAHRDVFAFDREQIRNRAATSAMNRLRLALIEDLRR